MSNVLINIDVDDLAKAELFYTEALALSVGRRFGSAGVELLGLAAPLYLLLKESGSKAAPGAPDRRDYSRHWTPVHMDIVVDDIDAAVARATSAGALLESAIKASKWGKLALMADPFGHGFCLLEFVGRGYDEIADPG